MIFQGNKKNGSELFVIDLCEIMRLREELGLFLGTFNRYDTISRSDNAKRCLIEIRTKNALDYGNNISLRKVSTKNIKWNSSKSTVKILF